MSGVKSLLKKFRLREKGLWRDYLFILVGSAIMGGGIGIFLVDAKVVPGGVSGLSMTIHYLSGGKIPVGIMMWVFNIPLFIWGVRELGKQFGARTFIGFTANSFFIDFFRGELPLLGGIAMNNNKSVLMLMQNDFLLSILSGGVLLGLGLGIIFKFRGTTAGSDVVAAVANKKFGIKPGQTFMVVDFIVITLAGLTIHFKGLAVERPALTLTLYAFILLFISSRIVDTIIDGFDYARSAMIVSQKSDEIAEFIINELSRGGTAFYGRGLYLKQDRQILYTVLGRHEIGKLMGKVKQIDPKAFVIVNNVHEVLGEGFRPRI
ncbi:YitT family protein [candidate division KSB1 bacterium]|nr:YitT family protein [candidate division KSB1 bacterium]RQW02024.1 MAG: YitT family protein [candidate division KSB1 bacterium]